MADKNNDINEIVDYINEIYIEGEPSGTQSAIAVDLAQTPDVKEYIARNADKIYKAFPDLKKNRGDLVDKIDELQKAYITKKPESSQESAESGAWLLDRESPMYYGNWDVATLNRKAQERFPGMTVEVARSKLLNELRDKAIAYEKSKVAQEMKVPFRKDLVNWLRFKVGQFAFPELYHTAEQGEGPSTWGDYFSTPMAYKDLGFTTASLLNPGSRAVGATTRVGRSPIAKTIVEGIEGGLQEGARQAASDYESLDPTDVLAAGVAGAVGGLATTKVAGTTLKKLESKPAKRLGKDLEDLGEDYGTQAEAYIYDLKQSTKPSKVDATDKEKVLQSIENEELGARTITGEDSPVHDTELIKNIYSELQRGKSFADIRKTFGDESLYASNYAPSDKLLNKKFKDMSDTEIDMILQEFRSFPENRVIIDAFKSGQLKKYKEPGYKSGLKDYVGTPKESIKSATRDFTKGVPKLYTEMKNRESVDSDDIMEQAETIKKQFPEEYEKWKKGFATNLTPQQKDILSKANIWSLGGY